MAQKQVCNTILLEDQKSMSLSSKRSGTSFTKKDRAPVQKLVRSGQRWAKVVNKLGWAGAAFADWMPRAWINTISETKFSKILNRLGSKSNWLWTKASEIFEDDHLRLLFAEPGTILSEPIILISIGKEDNQFDLVSRIGALERGFQNARRPSDILSGFPWNGYSCSLDARLLIENRLAEVLGEMRYREAADGE